jgi:hypothetical protein
MAANSGLDPEGHQEETFLLASAMLYFYETMFPRRHSDPAAKPDSAKKIIESVARSHRVRGVTMVSLEVVALACKGLCREYTSTRTTSTRSCLSAQALLHRHHHRRHLPMPRRRDTRWAHGRLV